MLSVRYHALRSRHRGALSRHRGAHACSERRGMRDAAPDSGGIMKFFIDTADIKEIREASLMGLVDGVTTNPSLVAKSGRKFKDVLLEICEIVKGPVNAEVVGTTCPEMVKEARDYASLRPNIVVKIPMTSEG